MPRSYVTERAPFRPTPRRRLESRRWTRLVATAFLAVLALPSGKASAQIAESLRISTSPALFPDFDPAISNYVIRGEPGSPVGITVDVPVDTVVSVNGQPPESQSFTTSAIPFSGQSISIVVSALDAATAIYSIRRLPPDFPEWTVERPGVPQAEWYFVSPTLTSFASMVPAGYIILMDGYGAPAWWYHTDAVPWDPKVLPNGDVAWIGSSRLQERRLDGSMVRALNAVGGTVDIHELQLLPDGNYLVIADTQRFNVDLSSLGGTSSSTMTDDIAEVIAPDGSLVWSWDAADHIPISEADRALVIGPDVYHMNSIEPDGDGFVISFRNLDAIYRVDKATGRIVWKLGGTQRPESLSFVNDPFGNFGGQHDARVLPDGTLTAHDNGTGRSRPPRAVRFALNASAKTASFIEQVTDPDVPDSVCCGDARKLPGGDWVISWGGNPNVTEFDPSVDRVFRLRFGYFFSYRVEPVLYGALARPALETGMDAQYGVSPLPGDVNEDGRIDAADLNLLLEFYLGLRTPAANPLAIGDTRPKPGTNGRLYGDGKIGLDDLTWAFQRFLSLETEP